MLRQGLGVQGGWRSRLWLPAWRSMRDTPQWGTEPSSVCVLGDAAAGLGDKAALVWGPVRGTHFRLPTSDGGGGTAPQGQPGRILPLHQAGVRNTKGAPEIVGSPVPDRACFVYAETQP